MAGVTVEQQRGDGVVLAVVRGELDISTAARFEEDLGDVAPARLVLDLSDLEFVDSTGLRTIVVAACDPVLSERPTDTDDDVTVLALQALTSPGAGPGRARA